MYELVFRFSTWLKGTDLSWFVNYYRWVWPAAETFHFIGLALLVGTVLIVDMRLLGIAKNLPFAPLHKLIPWGIFGFVINLLTGILFFAGDPFQYIDNVAFQWKMVFILLAGINVISFYLTVYKQADAMGPGDDAPAYAKVVAAVSIILWIGVMYLGRMLPFLGNSF